MMDIITTMPSAAVANDDLGFNCEVIALKVFIRCLLVVVVQWWLKVLSCFTTTHKDVISACKKSRVTASLHS